MKSFPNSRLIAAGVLALSPMVSTAWADTLSTRPQDYAISTNGMLSFGNNATTEILHPSTVPNTPATTEPAPIGGTSVMLNERSNPGAVVAKTSLKAKFLVTVNGNVTVTDGPAQFGRNSTIKGNLTANGNVGLGLSNLVEGDIQSITGSAKFIRLAKALGNIFVYGKFSGGKSISVGQAGKVLDIRGDALIADLSTYDSHVRYGGNLKLAGSGAHDFAGGIEQHSFGSGEMPGKLSWDLSPVSFAEPINPGTQDIHVTKDNSPYVIPAGAYRSLTIDQKALAQFGPGSFVFESIKTDAEARISFNLTQTSDSAVIAVKKDVVFGRRLKMDVKASADTERLQKAAHILLRSNGTIKAGPDSLLFGTYLAKKSFNLGKGSTMTGSAYGKEAADITRDSLIFWVPSALSY